MRFAFSCRGGSANGIHLRGKGASKCQDISIQVELLFLDAENRPAKDKQDFNIQFVLSCSAGWVSHPTHLDLMNTNRHFLASVDPAGLTYGAHCAYITAHNATNSARGEIVQGPYKCDQDLEARATKWVHMGNFQCSEPRLWEKFLRLDFDTEAYYVRAGMRILLKYS